MNFEVKISYVYNEISSMSIEMTLINVNKI